MPACHNPIEQLTTLAQLHHQMHRILVLARLLQAHNTRILRQMLHDRHLPPHVVHIHRRPELPLRNRLAGEQLPSVAIDAQVSHAELPPAQLPIHHVLLLDPILGHPIQHRDGLLASSGVLPTVIVAGIVGRLHILPGNSCRRSTTVPHQITAKIEHKTESPKTLTLAPAVGLARVLHHPPKNPNLTLTPNPKMLRAEEKKKKKKMKQKRGLIGSERERERERERLREFSAISEVYGNGSDAFPKTCFDLFNI